MSIPEQDEARDNLLYEIEKEAINLLNNAISIPNSYTGGNYSAYEWTKVMAQILIEIKSKDCYIFELNKKLIAIQKQLIILIEKDSKERITDPIKLTIEPVEIPETIYFD